MKFTFDIKDKTIKSAIVSYLETNLYEDYDKEILKAAKLPKLSALTNKIFADEKFKADLIKHVSAAAEEMLDDVVYEELMYEMDIPLVGDLIKQCDIVSEQNTAQIEAQRDAEEVKRMVNLLEKAGFKISKE